MDSSARSWSALLSGLDRDGAAVGWATVDDWATADGARSADVPLLGSEAPRFHAIHDSGIRNRFAASRRLLKELAGAALGVPPEQLDLAPDQYGRPYLRGHPGLDVNLSHTGRLLVAGFAWNRRIGVDVEPGRRRISGALTEELVCAPQELALLRHLPADQRADLLLRLWTLKEAFTKATGEGLRRPLRTIGFELTGQGAVLLPPPEGAPEPPAGWSFETHEVADSHLISAALSPVSPAPPKRAA
ncbi:4'-phosphopantetheinyl transferase superfamily protein [Streptacidiphilus sp. 4-A2]|nr:4'-phosphopantetheinyl transferase superfamily protein [Streptacidiphilus sp. 4-A2]